jgi:hypothetical protein
MPPTTQSTEHLTRERTFLLAVFAVIVGYLFIAAPDPGVVCEQRLRAETNMTEQQIADRCP